MSWTYTSGSYDGRYLQLTITEVVNESANTSTLNWTLTSAGGKAAYYTIGETTVTINGTRVYHKDRTYWDARVFPAAKGSVSGSVIIAHNKNGSVGSVNVSFLTRVYEWAPQEWANATISLTAIRVYTLSTSAGSGSSISVNRTSSGYADAPKGIIDAGTTLYKDDKLKITFTPADNHAITTHTVNGSSFTSGSTHTVSGNVAVVSAAIPLKSDVSAVDASIESASLITITRYNAAYTHTLTYNFNGLTGTIASKTPSVSVPWTIPSSFYSKIPNATSGKCTITCTTYNGSASLGSATCTITVYASSALCEPTVAGRVFDANESTVMLTGDSSILIRYRSTAQCEITTETKNYATVASKTINGVEVDDNNELVLPGVATDVFSFGVVDSRGYSKSTSVKASMVDYIPLTCNVNIYRPTPTGSQIYLTVDGNYFRGSFGAQQNALMVKYRYRESDSPTFGGWISVKPADLTIGAQSYRTDVPIVVGDDFDYQKEYVFQVWAYDGNDGIMLTNINKMVTVRKGIPVFDWGENDFTFHVPIKIGDTELTEDQLKKLIRLISIL